VTDGVNRCRAGEVIAALSVSGPAYRLDPTHLDQLGNAVRAGVAKVRRRMGWFSA
jgi:DNA-binding IclR family transcriptional regulator